MIDSLHAIPSSSLKYAVSEPWLWTVEKLEDLSSALGGDREGGWVRQGGAKIMIARRHWGSRAIHLDRELTQLSELTGKILEGEAPQSVVSAMAFFHCRFELIHPLHDGNGRVGRFIMACQAEERLGVQRDVFLNELHAQENDYRMTFVPDDLRGRYELTFDLIARLTGSEPSEEGIKVPFPIAPRYPEKKTKPVKASAKPKGNRPFWKRRF